MRGIPTKYKGVQFRSRLEAKWAAFFDLCGWKWTYEPMDFDGWIPDFVLAGAEGHTFVEVKPITMFDKAVAAEIGRSGCPSEVLLLGIVCPIVCAYAETELGFGWLAERCEGQWVWGAAIMGRWEQGKGQLGFCHEYQSYQDRISGGHDGGTWGRLACHSNELCGLWAEAGNKVQWSQQRTTRRLPQLHSLKPVDAVCDGETSRQDEAGRKEGRRLQDIFIKRGKKPWVQ